MKTANKDNKDVIFDIPILSGSQFDLSKFDFSFKNIYIYDIQSVDFERHIESLQPNLKQHNLKSFKKITEQIHSEFDKRYAIVNKNPKADYNYQDILNVLYFLLIIFPCDLQIEHTIHFHEENGCMQSSSMTSWHKRATIGNPEELLFASEEDIPEINEFAKIYFDRSNFKNYIAFAIENYLTSFTASHIHYQYLTLCIALESTLYGENELSYRLRRNVAILCGQDVSCCKRIYENIKSIYSLRSKIVHGEKYSIEKVQEYLKPLRAIVSRTIIELIIHNIPDAEKLNEVITPLAFGDRSKITKTWKSYKLNYFTILESNRKLLKK